MAITGEFVDITLRYNWVGQQMQSRRRFRCIGAAFLNAEPLAVAEAWWNDVKGVWRALAPAAAGNLFTSINVEEVGGGMAFGEYAIPLAEQTGTRVTTGFAAAAPSFLAVGCRFTVGTRLTRPGQMRFSFLYENDMETQTVGTAYKALANAVAAKYASTITLGAPVATGVLKGQVVHITDPLTGAFAAQDIVGYLVADNLTTQNSRKIGRGI